MPPTPGTSPPRNDHLRPPRGWPNERHPASPTGCGALVTRRGLCRGGCGGQGRLGQRRRRRKTIGAPPTTPPAVWPEVSKQCSTPPTPPPLPRRRRLRSRRDSSARGWMSCWTKSRRCRVPRCRLRRTNPTAPRGSSTSAALQPSAACPRRRRRSPFAPAEWSGGKRHFRRFPRKIRYVAHETPTRPAWRHFGAQTPIARRRLLTSHGWRRRPSFRRNRGVAAGVGRDRRPVSPPRPRWRTPRVCPRPRGGNRPLPR
mmetsp:Transcript_21912/g.64687  ORF Transcript_21912/g.64687 Transcript_21912/m.64687 type:complete len:257 (-) Transcript_21912:319-1089(-)